MDDMTPLDRQVAAEFIRDAGPSEPVDDLAIFNAITATRSPEWRFQSMFSATKFVVAGAIVALFGGFLLAGVLTQPSEQSVPAVGASASIAPPPSEEATSLAWERVEMPDGLDDTRVDLRSTGTHFVASSAASAGQAFVSRDGLGWSAVPIEGEVIGGYQGTLLVLDGSRLSAIRLAQDEGVPGDGLLAIESLELPFSGIGVMGGMEDATAYGPRGLVVAADDADRQTSIVWHSDDGRTWEQVYETEGEEWEEVIATPDGFVATSYRGLGMTVLHSTDGRDWTPLHEPSPGGYYKLAGSAPFGTVIRDLSGGDESRAILVGSSDGMEALTFPAEVETRLRARTPDSWGVGGLGAVGLFIPDRLVAYSVDGTTWHPATLPDEVPLLQGWNRIGRSTPHVTQDAVLLSTRVCLGPDGTETKCEDPYAEGDKSVWLRGTPSASTSAPETPTVDDLTPDDTSAATPDLLPGVDLVTEEVEPGVFRVVEDGHRELSRPVVGEGYGSSAFRSNLTVGQDSSVWVFGPERFFRLGDPREHASDEGTPAFLGKPVEVGPDGVVWAIDEATRALRSFDGTSWEDREDGVTAFDIAPDGVVWAHKGGAFERLGPDGWATVGGGVGLRGYDEPPRFWVSPLVHEFFKRTYETPDAEIEILSWPGTCDDSDGPGCVADIHLYGTTWNSGPAGSLNAGIRLMDMGDDGDYWMLQFVEVPLAGRGSADSEASFRTIDYLVHVGGGPATVYTTDEGVPEIDAYLYDGGPGWLRAGPEGTVWLTPGSESDDWCGDGVARFDGQTWTRFLRGTCVYALDVAPDGTAWVQGGTWDGSEVGPVETYAIAPEAVAAAE